MAKFNAGDNIVVISSDPAGFYEAGETGVVVHDEEKEKTIATMDEIFPGFAADTVVVEFEFGRVLFVGVDDIVEVQR